MLLNLNHIGMTSHKRLAEPEVWRYVLNREPGNDECEANVGTHTPGGPGPLEGIQSWTSFSMHAFHHGQSFIQPLCCN